MEKLHDWLIAKTDGCPCTKNVLVYGATRITVILPGVIRIEHADTADGFTDSATQSIWYRNHGAVDFTQEVSGKRLIIKTESAEFCIDTAAGKPVYARAGGLISKCSNKKNLKGTARTLDGTFGKIPLKNGVISRDGAAVVDDSDSLLLNGAGMVEPRRHKATDLYIFAFGRDYIGAVQALYKLTGEVPLIPRYVLGNWWSRYRAYTQDEYQNLMLEFERKEIPLTVATIDMDWHWVDIKKQFPDYKPAHGESWAASPGWTGYSWNTELFPDYRAFLKFLQERNLKTTVNLHPAAGIRSFEDMYAQAAKVMGVDPKSGATIPFDLTDPKFINMYFDVVHHPYEDEGVDFWWIDWQQGTKSRIAGLDPLWSLNHYHYLDRQRTGGRPMILSRYAGIGSHRYPLGFSGDTAMTWQVLRFQPYFTATASNCGYTWWSHDIGGHHFGRHSDEMYVRWLQLGVFSPILRLHSTSNDLFGKEPWNYSWDAEHLATEYLRLRHRLIPYIYAMNYRAHKNGRALCEPLYYAHPQEQEAFACKNAFMFGSELLVCPVTTKIDRHTKTACTKVYLPAGRWTNLLNGKIYKGGKTVRVHSGLEAMPVFAREGAIVPMSMDKGNSTKNPEKLKLCVYRGNNTFPLYEDDGESNAFKDGAYAVTEICVSENTNSVKLSVSGAKAADFLPDSRSYTVVFKDVAAAKEIQVRSGEKQVPFTVNTDGGLTIAISALSIDAPFEIILSGIAVLQNPAYADGVLQIMTRYNAVNSKKSITYMGLRNKSTREEAAAAAKRVKNKALRNALLEVLEDML